MIRIRLSRKGAKNNPFYRVVVIERRNRREGRALETIGYWHPAKDDKKIDKSAYKKWVEKGAQPTKSVINLFKL